MSGKRKASRTRNTATPRAAQGTRNTATAGAAAEAGAPPRLSLCMIVRNEERHLGACLAEASGFVDEMVVVDTGSSDRTREIAARAGARVFDFAWTGDFAAARNAALAQAGGDWILVLDADERMDDLNGARLRRLLESADPACMGFCVRIESEAQHRNSGVILAHYYPRVFRLRPGVRFEGALHEQVMDPEGPLASRAPRAPVVIWHLGYAETWREPERQKRNLAIVEEEARRHPDDLNVRRNLANTVLCCGDYPRARQLFAELAAAGLAPDFDRQARWSLAVANLQMGQFQEARQALEFGDATQGTRLLQAEVERRSGRPEQALEILQHLLTEMPGDRDRDAGRQAVLDFRAEPVHVRVQMAHCERARGYPGRARAHLEEALRLNPECPEAHLEMGSLRQAAGELEPAWMHLERAVELQPYLGPAYLLRARIRAAQGRTEEARAELERGLERLPSDVVLSQALVSLADSISRHAAREDARRGSSAAREEGSLATRETSAHGPGLTVAPAASGPRPGLTVAMIVRDAEDTLGAALESVRGVADDLVVVDTGSRDASPEIAERAGARVFAFNWDDDFSAARNAALREARGPWVLVLDADETLDPATAPVLRELVRGDAWDAAEVAIVNRLPEGGTVGRISHRYCRLFRKLEGVAFEGRVHEQILPSLLRAGARVAPCAVRLLHTGYGRSAEVLRAKQERNLRLLRLDLERSPRDPFLRFHLGVTLFALGRMDEASAALRACLAAAAALPVEALVLAHVKLAQVALAASLAEDAEAHLAEARALRPASALVRYLTAGAHFLGGRFAQAAEGLRSLLAEQGPGADAWEETLDPFELRSDLGNCLYRLGRFEEAEREYRQALDLRPESARLAYNHGNALYRCGRFGEALRRFELALRLDPDLQSARENAWQCSLRLAESLAAEGRESELAKLDAADGPSRLRVLVAGARLRLGRSAQACELLEPLVREDAGDAEATYLLALALRQAGRPQAALPHFERLMRGMPPEGEMLVQYALTLLDAGQADEASRVYEQALRLKPDLACRPAA